MKVLAKIIAGGALVSSLLAASGALACSYYIDEAKIKSDLAAKVVEHFNLSEQNVTATNVTKFNWWESKPTPMCPEELTYEATVSVSFVSDDALTHGCTAIAKVTKVEPWTPEHKPATYTFDTLQAPTCLE